MNSIQLEFNLEDLSEKDLALLQMQKQIDAACESMNKVRKKMFSELGEMKRSIAILQQENIELRQKLKERTEWNYQKDDCLFDAL
jgi:hypothetical protein